ncbi:MAG TPA: LysR family transcriptional regulator [Acetobacteraceae bacterium]|nr:LysR family transcriptional regulator [Acetobacteraceae bacterium]
MELRYLRYFVAVAEEGHITRAAERLGMQQPPLSQRMRALEDELGVQLLRRRPRGVELTEAGRTLLIDARAILAHLDHAFAATRRTARGEQGRIAVGFTSSAPFHPFVPRVIRAFREAFPLVSLTLDESGTIELVDSLRRESVDVAFVRTRVSDTEGLVVIPLLEEAMLVAVPRGHALAEGRGAVTLQALAGETFVVYRRPSGPGLYDAIIAACHAAGFSPIVGQEAPRIVSTLNLVAAGLGVCLVPASLQRMHMDDVVYRRLRDAAQPRAPLLLATRRDDSSAVVRRFVELTRRMARGFAQGHTETQQKHHT